MSLVSHEKNNSVKSGYPKIFDEANLNELANSIKERGILQPIIVRKSKNEQSKFKKQNY